MQIAHNRYLQHLLLSAFLLWTGWLNGLSATELKVRGDRVILRAAPSESSEIVSQVSDGDILATEKSIDGEWIEILPPEKVSFWVYGELVKDGVIAASKVQVRVGPGINYRAVGELGKDEKISVRGEYREWLKIAPPPGCRLWVNKKYVDAVDKPAVPETAVDQKSGGSSTDKKTVSAEKPVILSKPAVKPPILRVHDEPAVLKKETPPVHVQPPLPSRQTSSMSPEDSIRGKMVSSKEQGRIIQYSGVLRRAGLFVWRQPSKYRLVVHDSHGEAVTLCHLLGNESQLVPLTDRPVTIHGREYWIQGVRQPVVIPDKIVSKD